MSMKDLNNTSEEFCNEEFLNSIGKENPFVVPDGYFDGLTEINQFHARLSSSITRFDTDKAFTTPENYFENSQENILNEIRLRSLISSENESEFEVPEGYFENLQLNTLNKIKQLSDEESEIKETPVVTLPKKQSAQPVWKTWSRYAAAACILIVGALFFRNADLNENSVNFESLSDDEITEYLYTYGGTGDLIYISNAMSLNYADASQDMSDLSEEEIRWYLENSL